MKKIIEVDGEGLLGLMGKRVTFFCMNYIYTGKLVGVNDADVMLVNAAIVYETGDFNSKAWRDAQPLPFPVYVRLSAVEAYGELK